MRKAVIFDQIVAQERKRIARDLKAICASEMCECGIIDYADNLLGIDNKDEVSELIKLIDSDWQAIESADTETDRPVLLYPIDASFSSIMGYWDCEEEDEGGQCWRDMCGERIEPFPTHWRPISSGPSFDQIRREGFDA